MRATKLFAAAIAASVIAGPALAADLPSIKGPPAYIPPPPVFTWTGLYVGGQVGYQWGHSGTTLLPGTILATGLPGYSPNGVTGGAHVGYNYQVGQFVVGIEGDANGSSYYGSNSVLAGLFTYSTRETVNGSIRARAGLAWDRALIYATGGAAFGAFDHGYSAIGGLFTSTVNTNSGRLDGRRRRRLCPRQQLVDPRRISLYGLRPLQ